MLDLVSGVAELGTGMPGELRAAVFPVASGPTQPWALATFGLCRLELDQRLRVIGVARKGIGKYQTELLDLGQNLLGVGQRRGKSLLLVSKEDGSVRTRIRVAGACAAYPVDDGIVRLLGPHYGQAADLDLASGRIVARHSLPHGSDAIHLAGQVFAVLGKPKGITFTRDGQEHEPSEPVVIAVGDGDMPADGLGWAVLLRKLAVLDAATLDVVHSAPCPPDAVEVLGIDRDGLIVVGTQSGFILFDSGSLAVVDAYQCRGGISGAVLSSPSKMVALLGGHHSEDCIQVITW